MLVTGVLIVKTQQRFFILLVMVKFHVTIMMTCMYFKYCFFSSFVGFSPIYDRLVLMVGWWWNWL